MNKSKATKPKKALKKRAINTFMPIPKIYKLSKDMPDMPYVSKRRINAGITHLIAIEGSTEMAWITEDEKSVWFVSETGKPLREVPRDEFSRGLSPKIIFSDVQTLGI